MSSLDSQVQRSTLQVSVKILRSECEETQLNKQKKEKTAEKSFLKKRGKTIMIRRDEDNE